MKILPKKLLLISNSRCHDHIYPISRKMIWNPSLEDRDAFQKEEQQGRKMRQKIQHPLSMNYKEWIFNLC